MEATRHAAFLKLEDKFFTGRACKYGHLSPRYVSTGGCVACTRGYSAKFAAGSDGSTVFPAQRVHPDDHAQLYAAIDYLNQQRGIAPALRPGAAPAQPSDFEAYVAKQVEKPLHLRPSLVSIENAARVLGHKGDYVTTTRPVDDWSLTPEQHKALIQERISGMRKQLDRDGYLPDELDHADKKP